MSRAGVAGPCRNSVDGTSGLGGKRRKAGEGMDPGSVAGHLALSLAFRRILLGPRWLVPRPGKVGGPRWSVNARRCYPWPSPPWARTSATTASTCSSKVSRVVSRSIASSARRSGEISRSRVPAVPGRDGLRLVGIPPPRRARPPPARAAVGAPARAGRPAGTPSPRRRGRRRAHVAPVRHQAPLRSRPPVAAPGGPPAPRGCAPAARRWSVTRASAQLVAEHPITEQDVEPTRRAPGSLRPAPRPPPPTTTARRRRAAPTRGARR